MKFRIVSIGRPRDPSIAQAIADWERRAARYWPMEVLELREGSRGDRAPGAVRAAEGAEILRRLGPGPVIVCDERGESMTSEEFARWLQQLRERAQDVSFVLGGAWGLDASVRQRAERVLSLAPWTLQHELARLVLAEQLYRAGTIVRGEPYHK